MFVTTPEEQRRETALDFAIKSFQDQSPSVDNHYRWPTASRVLKRAQAFEAYLKDGTVPE